MGRRDPEEMKALVEDSREALVTLARLTARLEWFTDQLVAELHDNGGEDGGPDPGTAGQRC